LPGGGVEPGETMRQALTRELLEEGNIEFTAPPPLYSLYYHPSVSDRDHVALFVVRDFRQTSQPKPNHEIVAHGFFAPDEMPGDTTKATRARVAEVMMGMPVSEKW
jgi:8-oxo-dGTP pyrophosphatase MutT (NUDIX family)